MIIMPAALRPGDGEPDTPKIPADVNLDRPKGRFYGREREMDRIRAELSRQGGPMVLLHGMGGVGKTALAVQIAHDMSDSFNRPRVVIRLSLDDLDAEAAARREYQVVFNTLQEPSEVTQVDLDSQKNHYQKLLARAGRTLVIIDNATTTKQVEWFLPSHPAGAVLITSRFPLNEIVDACRIVVEPLREDGALAYLSAVIGPDRIAGDPEAAQRIIRLTGALPLALYVIVAFVTRPSQKYRPLSKIADLLADETTRLDRLGSYPDGKDLCVRASFDLSYRHLSAGTARTFRFLGLLAGPDFSADLAAAVVDVPTDETAHHLDELADAHLLTVTPDGRYGMHDLVRLYARRQAEDRESADARNAARERWFQWYLTTIAGWEPEMAGGEVPSPEALAWFVAEDRTLQASLAAAAESEQWETVLRLAQGLRTPLWYRGRYADLVYVAELGLSAAERGGLESKAIGLMIHLTQARRAVREVDGVAELYDRAERLALDRGDEGKAAWIRVHRGDFLLEQCGPEEAFAAYRSARQVYEARNDVGAQIWLAGHELDALQAAGRYDEAVDLAQQVVGLSRERDLPGEIAWSHGHLGHAYVSAGRFAEAEEHFTLAMQLPEAQGDLIGQAHRLLHLARVAAAVGDPDKARRHLHKALAFAEKLDLKPLVADITADLELLTPGGAESVPAAEDKADSG
jgi:tetratricopeptide (TPR) repeat protein